MNQAWQILAGLMAGLVLGAAWDWGQWPAMAAVVAGAEAIGGLGLDALKMTIVPLVFALIVSGILSTANAAAAGRITHPVTARETITLAHASELTPLVNVETGSLQAVNVANGITWTRLAFGRVR